MYNFNLNHIDGVLNHCFLISNHWVVISNNVVMISSHCFVILSKRVVISNNIAKISNHCFVILNQCVVISNHIDVISSHRVRTSKQTSETIVGFKNLPNISLKKEKKKFFFPDWIWIKSRRKPSFRNIYLAQRKIRSPIHPFETSFMCIPFSFRGKNISISLGRSRDVQTYLRRHCNVNCELVLLFFFSHPPLRAWGIAGLVESIVFPDDECTASVLLGKTRYGSSSSGTARKQRLEGSLMFHPYRIQLAPAWYLCHGVSHL